MLLKRFRPLRKTSPGVAILWLMLMFVVPVGPPVLFGQEGRDLPLLRDVRIEGLKRTKERVVADFIEIRPGEGVEPEVLQELQDRLIKSELFASVAVTTEPVDPGTVDVVVTVDEKWTLVPIPFFSTSGDGFSGGLILIETNLFGLNKQLIGAGFGGTDGVSGFFVYADPSLFGSSWSTSISASAGKSDQEILRADGERVRKYTLAGESAGLGVGYGITQDLRISGRLGVSSRRISDFRPGLDETEIEDASLLEPQIGIGYDGTRPVDVLLVGPMVFLGASWTAPERGWNVRSDFSWGAALFGTHRIRLIGSAGYGEMPVTAEASVSARDGFRTLPYQAATADRWSGGAVLYDLPVVSADWGAFVLSHYWEGGVYETEVLDAQPYYGPGGGFRVYIRQVAIPALGLDVAYNIADPSWVFSFTVGARM